LDVENNSSNTIGAVAKLKINKVEYLSVNKSAEISTRNSVTFDLLILVWFLFAYVWSSHFVPTIRGTEQHGFNNVCVYLLDGQKSPNSRNVPDGVKDHTLNSLQWKQWVVGDSNFYNGQVAGHKKSISWEMQDKLRNMHSWTLFLGPNRPKSCPNIFWKLQYRGKFQPMHQEEPLKALFLLKKNIVAMCLSYNTNLTELYVVGRGRCRRYCFCWCWWLLLLSLSHWSCFSCSFSPLLSLSSEPSTKVTGGFVVCIALYSQLKLSFCNFNELVIFVHICLADSILLVWMCSTVRHTDAKILHITPFIRRLIRPWNYVVSAAGWRVFTNK